MEPYRPTSRVLAVLELLQSRRRITGAQIAERLEVSPRTARRYVEVLRELGIPVEGERGRGGAYSLRPGFKLPPMMFTDEEALGLALGLLAVRGLGLSGVAPAIEGALAKLERVMPEALRERVRMLEETVVRRIHNPATIPRPKPEQYLLHRSQLPHEACRGRREPSQGWRKLAPLLLAYPRDETTGFSCCSLWSTQYYN